MAKKKYKTRLDSEIRTKVKINETNKELENLKKELEVVKTSNIKYVTAVTSRLNEYQNHLKLHNEWLEEQQELTWELKKQSTNTRDDIDKIYKDLLLMTFLQFLVLLIVAGLIYFCR